MDRYLELLHCVAEMKPDYDKAYGKGQRRAARQLRKKLKELQRLAHQLARDTLTEVIHARPDVNTDAPS